MNECDIEILKNLGERPNRRYAAFKRMGGKRPLAKKIASFLIPTQVYCEPFAGAASVFWCAPDDMFDCVVLNDIDEDVVTTFRVLQDPAKFAVLAHRLIWTPHSRREYERALQVLKDPNALDIDRAWAFITATYQSFNAEARYPGQWARSFTSDIVDALQTRMALLPWWHNRLTKVTLECRDGCECIKYWDTDNTLFYVDPPYHEATCRRNDYYKHNTTDGLHQNLVATLLDIKGFAILSCYWHEVYNPLIDAGWSRIDMARACTATPRTRATGLKGKGTVTSKAMRIETVLLSPRLVESKSRLFGIMPTEGLFEVTSKNALP